MKLLVGYPISYHITSILATLCTQLRDNVGADTERACPSRPARGTIPPTWLRCELRVHSGNEEKNWKNIKRRVLQPYRTFYSLVRQFIVGRSSLHPKRYIFYGGLYAPEEQDAIAPSIIRLHALLLLLLFFGAYLARQECTVGGAPTRNLTSWSGS